MSPLTQSCGTNAWPQIRNADGGAAIGGSTMVDAQMLCARMMLGYIAEKSTTPTML
jgi:hypothetical protein